MKRNILIFTLSFIIIILLFKNNYILGNTIINTTYLYLNNILPFLLSFFIISKILINYNLPYYIAKLFNNNIYIYILVFSILGGTPNNIILIKDLLNNNTITLKEANIYIKSSYYTNPLFLYNILIKTFNNKITLIILLSHYLSNIIIYLINPIKNNNIKKIDSKSLNKILIKSIKDAKDIFLNIYLIIIIFNIIISILPSIFNNYKGLIELTYGLNYINTINIKYKDILALIYISFSGLSIITQIKEILEDSKINFNNYLISRFYAIILSIIISRLFLLVLP